MPIIEDTESTEGVEGVDHSLLEACNGNRSVTDSSKLKPGVLAVEVLVKKDLTTPGVLNGNFGEIWIADEGG